MGDKQIESSTVDWDSYFYYDASSATGLKWKVDILAGKYRSVKRAEKDTQAGSYKKEKYYEVGLKNESYYVHRIIWELHYGEIPKGMQIDHIDGNSLNNEISNLRIVPNAINCRNQKKSKYNTSGVAGASWQTINGLTYARAQWYDIEGKQKCKMFSVKRLGLLPAFALACRERKYQIELLKASGAGYTERHGK